MSARALTAEFCRCREVGSDTEIGPGTGRCVMIHCHEQRRSKDDDNQGADDADHAAPYAHLRRRPQHNFF